MLNPFFYGNPVPPDRFVGRRRELWRITSRVANQGQSIAVVGVPKSGKTSLLEYLSARETRKKLFGECTAELHFSYLDAQTLGGGFSHAHFWEYCLHPVYRNVVIPGPDTPLAQVYKACSDNDFGTFVLQRLLDQMRLTGRRLVLVLDEFDVLLYHPMLNRGEFFGGLRSLASRSRGALALVIASRQSLSRLNDATQQLSRGSPYFNFLTEITLGSLAHDDVKELLGRAGDRFASEDYRFIEWTAGCLPYLVQVAASALWEAYEEGIEDPDERRRQAGHYLYEEAERVLRDTWTLWSQDLQRAVMVIGLSEMGERPEPSHLFRKYRFDSRQLARELDDFQQEIRLLTKEGFVEKDQALPCGCRIRPQIFLWWLMGELPRMARGEVPSPLESLLRTDKRQQWTNTFSTIGSALKEGAAILVKAAVEGAIGGMAPSP